MTPNIKADFNSTSTIDLEYNTDFSIRYTFYGSKSVVSQGPAVPSKFIMRNHKKFVLIAVHLPHFVCLFLVSISWRLTTFQFSGLAEDMGTLENGDFPHLKSIIL